MEKLISFRSMVDSLTANEFDVFLDKTLQICKMSKKELFSTLLFNYLEQKVLYKHNNAKKHIHIDEINPTLKTIIESRKKRKKTKQQQNNDNNNNNNNNKTQRIDDLPTEMIGEISSYLSLSQYSNFERCNRRIFVAARSPIQLKAIYDGNKIKNYIKHCNKHTQIINMNKFKMVQELTLDTELYVELNEWIGIKIWNNLRELTLFDKFDLSHFLNMNNCAMATIQRINLFRDWNSITYHDLRELLQSATNLQFLQLGGDGISITGSENDSDDGIPTLRSLNGLIINAAFGIKHFWKHVRGCNLQSLHLHSHQGDDNLNIGFECNNIKEICLNNPHKEDIDALRKINSNIQRMHMDVSYSRDYNKEDWIEYDTSLCNLMWNNQSLQKISITMNEGWVPFILDVLQKSFNDQVRDRVKVTLKIKQTRYNMDSCERIAKIHNITSRLFGAINTFKQWIKENFMLRIELRGGETQLFNDNAVVMMKKFMDSKSDMFWFECNKVNNGYNLIASNTQKYNIYDEKDQWILSCN